MRSKSVYKIPNGKLLKVFIEYDEKKDIIKNIKLTGDFFAYPEEGIEFVENNLKNKKFDPDTISTIIDMVIKKNNIQFIGLNVEGLTNGIMMCKK